MSINRILFFFCTCCALTNVVFAQQDTTEYLFKKAKYSYLQYSIGYSPMFFSNTQIEHGFACSLTGIVFNDKLAFGLDIDGFANTPPLYINSFPLITSCLFVALNVEPLIRPKKLINFSLPVKIGYGGAQIYDITPQGYGTITNPEFMILQPGGMVWINLFKPLSLGAGGSYRMCIGSNHTTFDRLSGFSGYVLLRFKFYTKEYMAKIAERQRLYMQQQSPPPN